MLNTKMSSEQYPKDFIKTTEVLPITKCGLSTFEEYKKTEAEFQQLDAYKRAGLSDEEIKLFKKYKSGLLDSSKVESSVLRTKLDNILKKISDYQSQNEPGCSQQEESKSETNILEKLEKKPTVFYPEGHPMNDIKELEHHLFGHLKSDIIPLTKRRKILRRLERKKERILAQSKELIPINKNDEPMEIVNRPGSLWDLKEIPKKRQHNDSSNSSTSNQCRSNNSKPVLGPKRPTMYTIKDNKIVRLERENEEREEFRAVDIVLPINAAEEQLLEGTKMSLDDIMKIERFKDYTPGAPSKVLYIKNIAPSVTQEQLSLLFNQFLLDNGGPIDVRLLSGHMRGQAFATFQNEDIAIRALDEVNGTILRGRPIIVQFGRNNTE